MFLKQVLRHDVGVSMKRMIAESKPDQIYFDSEILLAPSPLLNFTTQRKVLTKIQNSCIAQNQI